MLEVASAPEVSGYKQGTQQGPDRASRCLGSAAHDEDLVLRRRHTDTIPEALSPQYLGRSPSFCFPLWWGKSIPASSNCPCLPSIKSTVWGRTRLRNNSRLYSDAVTVTQLTPSVSDSSEKQTMMQCPETQSDHPVLRSD